MNSRKQRMQEGISALPGVVINSRSESSLPNTVNFSVDGSRRKGEDVLLELDIRGFYASSGSACSSGANRPSHVLMAQHANADLARNAVRISISPDTSDHEIDELLDALREIFQTH
jgi:cysteine desulfurase